MILFLIAGIMVLALYKAIYSYAAASGMLGEAARSKYEHQTEAGSGMLSMLMAGRSEFFIGLIAAMDRPIMGFGPRAEDTQGYAQSYFMKYGTLDDVGSYLYTQKAYYDAGVRMVIPSHSHIIAGWQWCGLPGLIFFIWVLYRLWKHMKLYSGVIPQWFGYYALAVPSMAWSIFFNPYGARWSLGLLMVCLAFSRSVSRGKMCLPLEMQLEAMKYDKK